MSSEPAATEVYYLVLAPPDLRAALLAGCDRLRHDNPGLDLNATASRRGLVQDAIEIMGTLSSMAGLITFVDWSLRLRRDRRAGDTAPIEFAVVATDGLPRPVRIDPDDTEGEIRRKITEAFGPGDAS